MVTPTKSEKHEATSLDVNELKVFVANTLEAVIEGVAEAQSRIDPEPRTIVITEDGKRPFPHRFEFWTPDKISFDIAVTVSRKGGKGGGLKLEVLSVGADARMESGRELSTASRVSFEVPIHERSDDDRDIVID